MDASKRQKTEKRSKRAREKERGQIDLRGLSASVCPALIGGIIKGGKIPAG